MKPSPMQRLLICLCLASPAAVAELPLISDARIIQPPPGAPVAGGYLTINNTSEDELVVNGASSEHIATVELHLSEVVDDVATMREMDQIVVPAGGTLEFKHGSYHLMLMGLDAPLQAGDDVQITIESSAGPIPVTLPVVRPGEHTMTHQGSDGSSQGHWHGHGQEMDEGMGKPMPKDMTDSSTN